MRIAIIYDSELAGEDLVPSAFYDGDNRLDTQAYPQLYIRERLRNQGINPDGVVISWYDRPHIRTIFAQPDTQDKKSVTTIN